MSTKLREFLIRNQIPYVGKLKSITKVIPIPKSKEATQIVDLIFQLSKTESKVHLMFKLWLIKLSIGYMLGGHAYGKLGSMT